MNRLIQLKKATSIFLVALVCFGLLPTMQAVSPAPDGGYAGGNTAEGEDALFSLTSGTYNTAVGLYSLFANTTSDYNTAVGAGALHSNISGDNNTATGAASLLFNTTGANNTANGVDALAFNDSGSQNTANGAFALSSNTTGTRHTAVGFGALQNCIAPPAFSGNTAIGAEALFSNTTGNFNTAIGDSALFSNTIGVENTAIGNAALQNTTIGIDNVAVGLAALQNNTLGSSNVALGASALLNNVTGLDNQAVGRGALRFSTGNQNIAIGREAGSGVTTAHNVICIGANLAGANVNNTCYIDSIFGQTSSGGAAVFINSNGQLGTLTSSRQFKDEIKTMDKASEALFALKPVTFRYKKEIDALGTPQFGLVAEDVANVNPHLVVRDQEGKPYSVRYEVVNAMLLNEFLKEHRKVEQLEKQVEALTAGLQRVSARLEASKAAPQVIVNNQ